MRKQLQDQRQWHPVFAWFPVVTEDGLRVWLECVERRYKFSSWFDDYYEFRLPSDSGSRAERQDPEEGLGPKDGRAASEGGIAQPQVSQALPYKTIYRDVV